MENAPCEKKTFATKTEADKCIVRISLQGGNHVKPVRSYRCAKCGCFHLTSQAGRVRKKQDTDAIRRGMKRAMNAAEAEYEYWAKRNGW